MTMEKLPRERTASVDEQDEVNSSLPGQLSKQELHERGECRPCAYFWQKEDGCRLGDECIFCHSCDREALKLLKKQKRQKMRLNRRIPLKEERSGSADTDELDLEPAKVLLSESFNMATPAGFPSRPYMPAHVYVKECVVTPPLSECSSKVGKLIEEYTPLESSQPACPQRGGRTLLNLGEALCHVAAEPPTEEQISAETQLKFQDMFPELAFLFDGHIKPPPNLLPPDLPFFAPPPNLPHPLAAGAGSVAGRRMLL